jgi:Phosphodiester glycosidase
LVINKINPEFTLNMIYMEKTIVLALIALLFACKKDPPPVEPPDTGNKYTLIQAPTGWTRSETLSSGLPQTAAFFETSAPFRAFACVFDLNDTTLRLRTAMTVARRKPVDWLSNLSSTGARVLMVANGGYFDLTNGASFSLVVDSNRTLSYNIRALSRNLNNVATTYYPTRGAFGLVNGSPSVGWVFNTSGADNYMYPAPSPNALNTPPQPIPSATFPAGGALWRPSVAIGGSPVLIYKNNINISDAAELIDINNTTGRSRTAIGYTADKRVVLLVVERSAANGTNGANLQQTAQLMKDWGCTDALNLDGGGSTCMLGWGNRSSNTPEAGDQRAVTSVVYLVKR